MSNPTVTVLIPAYNAANTIERALRSVLLQHYEPIEIVVVDDGSTDDTSVVAGRYVDRGVCLIALESNSGECAAMNAGLRAAQGEYIAFLDADDEWLGGKLAKQVARMVVDPGMSFTSTGWWTLSRSGTKTLEPSPRRHPSYPADDVWRDLLAGSFVLKSTVLARRSKIVAAGDFDTNLTVAGDQDMWIRLALLGPVGFSPEPSIFYHVTADSLTERYDLQQADFVLPMVKKHLEQQRERLSAGEIRRILGRRYSTLGRNLYLAGGYLSGIHYILRAVALGYEPFQNLWHLLTASPPTRMLKEFFKRSRTV